MQDCYLAYFLTEVAGSAAMVFTRTCDSSRRLALLLRNLGFGAVPIHGHMSQPKRIGALNKFKGGERSLLICTGALAAARSQQSSMCLSLETAVMHAHETSSWSDGLLPDNQQATIFMTQCPGSTVDCRSVGHLRLRCPHQKPLLKLMSNLSPTDFRGLCRCGKSRPGHPRRRRCDQLQRPDQL